MSNGAEIRTMQDDIDEAKKNLEKRVRSRQKSQVSDIAEESIKRQPLQPKPIQFGKFSLHQAADLRERQIEEDSSVSSKKEERKPIFISPEKSADRSKKANGAEDNELKNLIKRISKETDEDRESDEDSTRKKIAEKEIPQMEKNGAIGEKTADKNEAEAIAEKTLKGTADNLTAKDGVKNTKEIEALKKDLDKIETEEKIREKEIADRYAEEMGTLEKNTKEIEDLKKMISRISKSSGAKEETGAKTDKIERSEEIIQENNNIKPSARQYKRNLWQSPHPAEAQKIEDEPVSTPASENEGKSFWKNVLEQTKKTGEPEKINDLKNENLIPKIKTGDEEGFEKYDERSGILQNKNRQKEESKEESLPIKTYNENYTPPSERLAWGKQEFYSSVIKKIKPREEKGEIESLKSAAMLKNRQILSKDEEYKKLKHSIARKYHIKLFSLPWKKIIPLAIIVIALAGIVSYFAFSETNPFIPSVNPPVVIGDKIEKFSGLEKEIMISKKDLQGFNNLESEALNIFNSNGNIKIIKLFVVNNEKEKKVLSLPEALDSIGITNTKGNINYLPNGFLQAAANSYNIFIFKTNKGTIRYGLAIKADNTDSLFSIMRDWEKEEARSKKMSSVLKPLFVNDKNFEEAFSPFSASFYKNVEIRYVHLVDKNTALNYFFYEDILIFTTSKDTAFTTIDFLIPGN